MTRAEPVGDAGFEAVTTEQWEALARRRIFFGHRSVGRNIVTGMRRILEDRPEIALRTVTGRPGDVEGPAFIGADLGENRRPETKDRAFADVLAAGFGDDPGSIAMYKYCYADMVPDTDPDALFERYARHIETLERRYQELLVVHVTMPLRSVSRSWMERIKTRLGRTTATLLNRKRNRFNDRMRARYGGRPPLFDLARLESTDSDGERTWTPCRGHRASMLAPEWTPDGGHLSEDGRRYIGRELLVFLAELTRRTGDEKDSSGRHQTQ